MDIFIITSLVLVMPSIHSLPAVTFIEEPVDVIVPWKGHSELTCRVNYSGAVYSWSARRYAPIDLHYSNGFLVPTRSLKKTVESETEVIKSQWCHPQSEGRLTIIYPGSPDPPETTSSEKVTNSTWRLTGAPWLEGVYRCKATIPGYGSLLSRWAQVRLSDLFLEPGATVTSNQIATVSRSAASVSAVNGIPNLGGGSYWPGEVAVLRCPIKAISEEDAIYRWYFASTDGSLMQPVGLNPTTVTGFGFATTALDDGRWLEIRLGQIEKRSQESTQKLSRQQYTMHMTNQISNSVLATAGFGEYFCKVKIPRTWATSNFPEGSQLNLTGPYIPVYLAPDAQEPVKSTLEDDVQPVWVVTPDILVRVEMPSPPGVHEAQFKEGEELKDRSTTTLWRPAGGSVTLLCAVNLRGHSTESADLNWWSWGSIHVGRKTPETSSVGHNYRLEWTKDGTVVSAQGADGRVSNIGTGHLRIRELQLGDSGVYECRVIRPHMTLGRSSITLSVGHAPKLVGPTEQTVSGHIQAEKNMSCTFVTQRDASFTWTKNAEPVKHSQYFRIGQWSTNGSHDQPDKADQGTNTTSWSVQQRTELSIYGLLPNDEGYFQCFAVNRFGSSQAIYALHVRSPFLTGYQTLGDGVHYSIPLAPSHASVQGLGDTQAYITWTPPEPALKAGLNDSIGYMIRLRTQGTPQGLILNTSKPALLLTDLRPDSHYNVDVFTVNLSNGHHSPDSTSVHFRTKPLVYRPSAVTDLAADAGEFRTLVISWKLPLKPNIPRQPDDEISHYRITMFNLKPNMSTDHLHGTQTKPMHISIPVHQIRRHGDRFTHVVPDLTPDTFYQVSVQAVTVNNVTGYPAVLSSSARVASRPPSKPPTQVRVQAIGARVATVTWQPPPEQYRNGELILYRINITCEDWLRPRQIDVLNSTSKLIRGLIKSTKYELTVSAATRGGNGPDSALVAFTTMNEENAADREASQTESGYFLPGDEDLNPYGATHEKATVTDLKRSTQLNAVENLRAIEDERSILLLWSPPIMWTSRDAKASPALDRYVVKWGQLYPGPQSVTVSANQTRLLIDNLEADTPYMIEVSVYNKNQEAASAMISGRTKPAQFRHRLLIPINLQVTSVDPDGAVVIWDEPKCSAQSVDTISAVECLNKELIKYYQVAYRMIGVKEDKSSLTLDSSAEAEETDTLEAEASLTDTRLDLSTHMLNVSRTVVRLEQLQAGRRYSVMVRAVGKAPLSTGNQEYDLTSEWSMEQVFETPQHKPGDAPHDVSLTALPFTPGDGPVSVQVSWQPPLRPHGRLIGYILYFTADRQLPLHQWSKRRLPADSLNTVLSGLFRGSIYFVQLRARNQHGNGPLSPIRLYRTPDVFGQGGGVIPLGRTYHNATSIPSEFLTFGQTMIDDLNSGSPELGAVQQSVGKPEGARPNNTPMLAVGTLTGLGLLGLAVLLAVIWWRRHRRPFIPVLSYKSSGSHVDSAPNPDGLRSLSKTGSIGSHGAKRGRGAYPNQDIALLMSNGEALNSADPCSPQTLSVQQRVTPTGRHAPNDQLTTSVQLSTGSARPLNVANALHAALLQQQLQNHNRTPSWDRDSDSLQFASVSLQRQADGTPIPGLFDMNPSNNTPTRTGSASTNSGPGSVCTPTRTTGNPAYQTQTVAGFAPEVSMAHSYASSSLGVTSGTVPLILPRSPLNQYQLGASPGYAGGLLNGTAAVVAAVSSSGGLLMPSYYPTTMAYQAIQGSAVPGQPMFLPTTGSPNMFGAQNSSFPVVNAQYLATNSISVNVPRVNAADLMSFTSSDDIRPIMSTSVHKEGSSLDEAISSPAVPNATTTTSFTNTNTTLTGPNYSNHSATNDIQLAPTHSNTRTTSGRVKQPRVNGANSQNRKGNMNSPNSQTNSSNIWSPKRRPPQTAKSDQSRSKVESRPVTNGKDSKARPDSENGDGAEDEMNVSL